MSIEGKEFLRLSWDNFDHKANPQEDVVLSPLLQARLMQRDCLKYINTAQANTLQDTELLDVLKDLNEAYDGVIATLERNTDEHAVLAANTALGFLPVAVYDTFIMIGDIDISDDDKAGQCFAVSELIKTLTLTNVIEAPEFYPRAE